MGLFGEKIPNEGPITILHPKIEEERITISDLYTVRTCTKQDDPHIANLRLSVFSNAQTTESNKNYFQKRSCDIIKNRRTLFDSICLVVTIPSYYYNLLDCHGRNVQHNNGKMKQFISKKCLDGLKNDEEHDWIIGSLECSFHEFHGTILGASRPRGALMYITEVAVSPFTRRCGIGTKLLQGMEELAKLKKIETLYLHVETNNIHALHMYSKFGFHIVLGPYEHTKYTNYPQDRAIYKEFSQRLNLYNDKNEHNDGVEGLKYYYLMKKDLVGGFVRDIEESEVLMV